MWRDKVSEVHRAEERSETGGARLTAREKREANILKDEDVVYN